MRLGLPRDSIPDPLQAFLYLILIWLVAAVTWAWSKVDVPMEVALAGYVAAFFGLLDVSILEAGHSLKLFRWLRTQWRRTFPRRRRRRGSGR